MSIEFLDDGVHDLCGLPHSWDEESCDQAKVRIETAAKNGKASPQELIVNYAYASNYKNRNRQQSQDQFDDPSKSRMQLDQRVQDAAKVENGRQDIYLYESLASMRALNFPPDAMRAVGWAIADRFVNYRPERWQFSHVEAKVRSICENNAPGTSNGYLRRNELPAGESQDESERSSWQWLDLGLYLSGTYVTPEPSIGVRRADGLQFLYAGKEHTVIGEMESGKSWFLCACAAEQLHFGKSVIYIHFEETDPSDTVERLRLLAVDDKTIREHFHFVAPEEPVKDEYVDALLGLNSSLVILDGVNEAMSLHGMLRGGDPTNGAAEYRRKLVKPWTRAGITVLSADHVVKDKEKRDRGPIGGVHKGNGLTGSLIMLENVEPFGRGRKGCSHIFVTKDRPGFLRRHGKASKLAGKNYMGTFIIDDSREFSNRLELLVSTPKDESSITPLLTSQSSQDDDCIIAKVEEITNQGKDASLRQIRAISGMSKDRVNDAIERLKLNHRLIEESGPNRARLFRVWLAGVAQDPLDEF